MRATIIVINPLYIIAPVLHKQIDQRTSLKAINIIRTNIIITSILTVLILHSRNHQICVQRLQYMLIRTSGERITDNDILMLNGSANAVWDNAVVCKITTADNITGTCSGNCNSSIGKKAILIAVRYQLRAGFRIGVRVISIQLFVFSISPPPFFI